MIDGRVYAVGPSEIHDSQQQGDEQGDNESGFDQFGAAGILQAG
jgi:hypothetical protein